MKLMYVWFLILYKGFTVHLYTFGDNLYHSSFKIVQDFLLANCIVFNLIKHIYAYVQKRFTKNKHN